MLWSRLRAKKFGFKVRRQYAHGPYIMDFYIHELSLCIEIDGGGHELRELEDARRSAYMKGNGITTIRIAAKRILEDIDGVVEGLYHSCCERSGRDPLGLQ